MRSLLTVTNEASATFLAYQPVPEPGTVLVRSLPLGLDCLTPDIIGYLDDHTPGHPQTSSDTSLRVLLVKKALVTLF